MANNININQEQFYTNEILQESNIINEEFVHIKVRGGRCYAFFKRLFDIVVSFVATIIISPLLIILWLLVKLTSKGPGIYTSIRVSKNGKKFKFYKFRSMVVNAEEMKKDLMNQNEMKDGVYFKMKDDPRITKIGKFLRKTSLDELPQLFNILKGDISIVGCRPCLVEEYEKMSEYQKQRFLVPAGLTGEWQVRARSTSSSFEEVVKYDLDYIQNKRGFWYDIKLIFLTIGVVLSGKGAE